MVSNVTTAAAYPEPASRRPPFADASAAEVRAALIPEEAAEFDRQWRDVVAEAARTSDDTRMQKVLDSWRRIAWSTVASGSEVHRQMYRRAAAKLTGHEIPADEPLWQTKARLGL
jgi:hypothetical protein